MVCAWGECTPWCVRARVCSGVYVGCGRLAHSLYRPSSPWKRADVVIQLTITHVHTVHTPVKVRTALNAKHGETKWIAVCLANIAVHCAFRYMPAFGVLRLRQLRRRCDDLCVCAMFCVLLHVGLWRRPVQLRKAGHWRRDETPARHGGNGVRHPVQRVRSIRYDGRKGRPERDAA